MSVTAVIITLNEVHSIADVLTEMPKDYIDEILVVDGNSDDGTPELVRFWAYESDSSKWPTMLSFQREQGRKYYLVRSVWIQ